MVGMPLRRMAVLRPEETILDLILVSVLLTASLIHTC